MSTCESRLYKEPFATLPLRRPCEWCHSEARIKVLSTFYRFFTTEIVIYQRKAIFSPLMSLEILWLAWPSLRKNSYVKRITWTLYCLCMPTRLVVTEIKLSSLLLANRFVSHFKAVARHCILATFIPCKNEPLPKQKQYLPVYLKYTTIRDIVWCLPSRRPVNQSFCFQFLPQEVKRKILDIE